MFQISQICHNFFKSFLENRLQTGSFLQEEEVNDILMKVEMKKFEKMIENRVKNKNALLNPTLKRLYPLSRQSDAEKCTENFSLTDTWRYNQ